MNAEYFKDQITDELNGAACYIKRAIEIRPMSPTWAKLFVDMSSAELAHASNLYKMFSEYYQKITETYKEVPAYIEDIKSHVDEIYPEMYAKVRYMHEMYSK